MFQPVSINDVKAFIYKHYPEVYNNQHIWINNISTAAPITVGSNETHQYSPLTLYKSEFGNLDIFIEEQQDKPIPKISNSQTAEWRAIFTYRVLFNEDTLENSQEGKILKEHPELKYILQFLDTITNSPIGTHQKVYNQNTKTYSSLAFKNVQGTNPNLAESKNYITLSSSQFSDKYTKENIHRLFIKAYNSFLLIKSLDKRRISLITGNWGCRLFLNNPTLIALIQFAAAELAGIRRVIYQSMEFTEEVKLAQEIYGGLRQDFNKQGDHWYDNFLEKLVEFDFPPSNDKQNLQKKSSQIKILFNSAIFNFSEQNQPNDAHLDNFPDLNNSKKVTLQPMQSLKGDGDTENQGLNDDFHPNIQSNLIIESNSQNQLKITYSDLLKISILELYFLKDLLYKKFNARINWPALQDEIVTYQRCCFPTTYQASKPSFDQEVDCQVIESGYVYNLPVKGEMNWHVNFAHDDAFAFYSSPLFAQDEIQTSEHPLLYHLREAVMKSFKAQKNLVPLIFGNKKEPTPILITNVLCQGYTNTSPTPKNPMGLYGNNFMYSTTEIVDRASIAYDVLSKQQGIFTNLICMCSLSLGSKVYKYDEIVTTFNMAFKSFREAVLMSRRQDQQCQVVINTGNWGCGAFGNNPEFIAVVQILAADVAGVNRLNYYSFNRQGKITFDKGNQTYKDIRKLIFQKKQTLKDWEDYVQQALSYIFQKGYVWGNPDGN